MSIDLPLAVFIFACSVQLIFLLLLIKAFVSYRSKSSTDNKPISLVIAAHDGEENLRKLLPKLYEQQHVDFEIIIVDDRSNDNTYDLLLDETKKHANLKMVRVTQTPEKMNSKKYALTLGIKAAKYENIVFTDADCFPESNLWLSSMSSNFSNPAKEINLGVSLYIKSKGFLNAFIRFEAIWTAIQYVGMAMLGMPYMGVGRNLAYKKSLFLNNKGFNSHISTMGGDDDLFVNKHARAKNTSVQIGADSLVYSIPKSTWSEFITQKIRHLSVGKYYKFSHKLMLGLLALSHLVFWVSSIGLAIMLKEPYLVAAGFIIRTLLLYITFFISSKKFGARFRLWGLVFLDFIFVFYYLSTGMRTLFTKRVRWS
jgi:glycosyltransferase involved in cell wall biosynthesis